MEGKNIHISALMEGNNTASIVIVKLTFRIQSFIAQSHSKTSTIYCSLVKRLKLYISVSNHLGELLPRDYISVLTIHAVTLLVLVRILR